MLRVLLLLALLSLISAFIVPSNLLLKKNVLTMSKFDKEIGALPPLGYFDPLGLLKDADQTRFDRLRYVENKHGRIAMLAVLGHIVTTKGDRLPGDIAPGYSFSSIKGGLGALTTLPQQGVSLSSSLSLLSSLSSLLELWEIVAFIGLMEWGFGSIQKNIEEYCNDIMKGYKWNDATIRRKQEIELNNGRAAQMGILGLMVHEKLNGDPYVLNSLLGYPVSLD